MCLHSRQFLAPPESEKGQIIGVGLCRRRLAFSLPILEGKHGRRQTHSCCSCASSKEREGISTEKHGIIRPEKVGVQEGRKTVADLNFGQTMATCVPEDAEFSPLYAY